ncbi:MAG TPA: tol-pal system protein YbgF [Enhygromyxa sp.]|nr:tol-pal system protein YbgF [Enhygromyxa sp.]
MIAGALSLLALGCAHNPARSEAPVPGEDNPELAQLRRDNAALRNRVQNLEERVRMLERGEGVASLGPGDGYQSYGSLDADPEAMWQEPDLDGPRQLPVVKLTPSGKSIEHRQPSDKPAPPPTSATRGRSSIALSPVPHSGAPSDYAGDYVVDTRESGYDDAAASPESGSSGATPASYRLVGSKLVEATKRKPVAPTNRDRDSGVAKAYDAAMKLYKDGRYSDAEQAFAAIVSAHPNHDYADNALYWQGEAAYDQAHYADALAAFTKVVERYGGGNKAPDALLKIGLCYGRLGDAANARDVLTQLIAAYPSANASKIAKRKLADLED